VQLKSRGKNTVYIIQVSDKLEFQIYRLPFYGKLVVRFQKLLYGIIKSTFSSLECFLFEKFSSSKVNKGKQVVSGSRFIMMYGS